MNWTDQDLTSTVNAGQPGNATGLSGFDDTTPNQGWGQHAFYIGADQHLHQLFFNSKDWVDQDLTARTGGPQVSNGSSLSSGPNVFAAEYVCYVGVDQHVHLLGFTYATGAWVDQDLTTTASSPMKPVSRGALSFFADNSGLHAFYVGTDQHVHQLYFGQKWGDQDLTSQTNGPQVATGSGLSSFSDPNPEHVFYIGADQHVHQLYFNGTWIDQDLTRLAAAQATASSGSALSSFADTPGEHVFYVGADQHLHQLYWNKATWGDQDLTIQSNGPQVANGSAVASLVDNNGEHAFYVGVDDHLHELPNQQPWADQDLTSQAKGPQVANGSAVASFLDVNGGEHVLYIGADQHVHHLHT
jgi:hypothetical protein